MVCLNRGAARGTVGTVCTVSDFSHQILFMVSQGKYLLSFKNIFENFYIAQKMYPLRDVKDLLMGGVCLSHVQKLCYFLQGIVTFVSIAKF